MLDALIREAADKQMSKEPCEFGSETSTMLRMTSGVLVLRWQQQRRSVLLTFVAKLNSPEEEKNDGKRLDACIERLNVYYSTQQ